MHCHPPRIRILFRSRIIIDYEPTYQSKTFPLFQPETLSFGHFVVPGIRNLFHRLSVPTEREYKVELLNTQLQDYNSRLYEQLNDSPAIEETTDKYIRDHALKDLRVTLIDLQEMSFMTVIRRKK